MPRGVLLVGPQGNGKSLTAKAIAHSWSMPLLRLDVGRLFAGLVGASEARTRDMIQQAVAARKDGALRALDRRDRQRIGGRFPQRRWHQPARSGQHAHLDG
jgi:ATP-dependent 26S proteasome regulatory subunit